MRDWSSEDTEYDAAVLNEGLGEVDEEIGQMSLKMVLTAEQDDKVKIVGWPVWTVKYRKESYLGPILILDGNNGQQYSWPALTATGDRVRYPLQIRRPVYKNGSFERWELESRNPVEGHLVNDKEWEICKCRDQIQTLSHYLKSVQEEDDHGL